MFFQKTNDNNNNNRKFHFRGINRDLLWKNKNELPNVGGDAGEEYPEKPLIKFQNYTEIEC